MKTFLEESAVVEDATAAVIDAPTDQVSGAEEFFTPDEYEGEEDGGEKGDDRLKQPQQAGLYIIPDIDHFNPEPIN